MIRSKIVKLKYSKLLKVTVCTVTFVLSASLYAESSKKKIESRVQQLEQQNNTRGKLQSEMSMQVNSLQKEVKELRGIIEEREYQLKQVQERQRDLYRDIENRFSQMSEGTGEAATVANNKGTQTSNKGDLPPVASPNIVNQVRSAIRPDDGRLEFQTVFKLVRSKQYSEAIQGFEAFLEKYPAGQFSDNARFWMGQVYFAQSDIVNAEKQFSLLKQEYPTSSKLAATELKLAEIKIKQKKWQDAKDMYNNVLKKYSGSSQQLARKGLREIEQAGH